MKTEFTKWDQSDYVAHNASLCERSTVLETQLRAKGGTAPPRPPTTGDLIADYDALSAHVAQLRVKVSMASIKLIGVKREGTTMMGRRGNPHFFSN